MLHHWATGDFWELGYLPKCRFRGLFLKSSENFSDTKSIRETKICLLRKMYLWTCFQYNYKVHDFKRFPFEDTKRFTSTEIRPKSFESFKKPPTLRPDDVCPAILLGSKLSKDRSLESFKRALWVFPSKQKSLLCFMHLFCRQLK